MTHTSQSESKDLLSALFQFIWFLTGMFLVRLQYGSKLIRSKLDILETVALLMFQYPISMKPKTFSCGNYPISSLPRSCVFHKSSTNQPKNTNKQFSVKGSQRELKGKMRCEGSKAAATKELSTKNFLMLSTHFLIQASSQSAEILSWLPVEGEMGRCIQYI